MIKKLLTFTFVFILSSSAYSQNADINLLHKINPVNPVSSFWIGCTNSAYPVTILVQGGLMAYDYFRSDSSRGMIPAHIAEKLVVVALTEAMKYMVNRQRPYITYPGSVHPYETSETGLSFPSAHTSLSFNTAATLSIRFHKWYITVPAYLWASCVGYSRLYLVKWIDRKLYQKKIKRHLLLGNN